MFGLAGRMTVRDSQNLVFLQRREVLIDQAPGGCHLYQNLIWVFREQLVIA